jgi:cell division septal protein FtsQ
MNPSTENPPNRQFLISYALFVATAALLVAGFAAPNFRVTNVHVVGRDLPVSQIATASHAQGRNIFTIRAASLLNNLRRVPTVMITGVELAFPDSVTIRASMRQPVLGWRTRSDLYLVDEYGRLISHTSSTRLPVVRDTTPTAVALGGYVSENIVVAVTWALRMLKHADINRVTLGVRRGLVLGSGQGWRAVLGIPTARALAKRVNTLRELLALPDHTLHRLRLVDLTLQPPYVSRT